MPIKIPHELPAYKKLQDENIFVMSKSRAEHQDIRPLKIIILNIMPKKIETETQILRLLSNTPLQVDIELLYLESHISKNTPVSHLSNFYTTFEQIKKQLNRMVEVIKVIDFTDLFVRMKEILYVKVKKCSREDKAELFRIAETYKAKPMDIGRDSLLIEFVQTATKNDAVIKLMKEEFQNIEVVRGGSVGIESISMMER